MSALTITKASAAGIPVLLELIGEMAAYERSAHALEITAESLGEHLFGPRPCAEALLGFWEGQPAAYAILVWTFSSYRGRPSLYIEDVFVRERMRGLGIGKEMMAAIARLAVERNSPRLHWSVLDWNEPAIGFYERLGAAREEDRRHYYLLGEDLRRLAGAAPDSTPRDGG